MKTPLSRTLAPYLLAFLAGFQILTVEMVAGRFINLHLGSSIYGWTALIGVVLGGVSIGNVLGGMLAGQRQVRKNLGEACLLCAFLTIVVLRTHPLLMSAVHSGHEFPWSLRVFGVVMALLFAPSVAFGLISPLAAKWALALHPDRPGEVLGTMSALGTWGAIIGTFCTGFWLIGLIGSASLLLTTASLVGMMGMWLLGAQLMRLGPVPIGWLPFALVAIGIACTWPLPGREGVVREARLKLADSLSQERVLYFDESNYFTIRVMTSREPRPGPRILELVLDHLVHGFVVEGEPLELEYPYEHVYSWATRRWSHAASNPAPRALYLGGGSYTWTRWLQASFPESKHLVAEIDPRVVEAVHAQMGLPRDTPIVTRAEDARRVIETEADASWDLIYGDAFNSFSIPFHLTTQECLREIRRLLAPGGMYLMNVIDIYDPKQPERSRFVGSIVRTMDAVFGKDHVHVWVDGAITQTKEGWGRTTFVVVATTDPLDLTGLGRRSDYGPGEKPYWSQVEAMRGERLEAIRSRGLLLTDDYSPVEQLLAPVASTRAEVRKQASNPADQEALPRQPPSQ